MRIGILLFALILASSPSFSQEAKPSHDKWLIALPLRFTHLQNHSTMLSGIKLGRKMGDKVAVALSVYHSFYLEPFKAPASLPEFTSRQMPRLFINGVGPELHYTFWNRGPISSQAQLMLGWGFMKYESKQKDLGFEGTSYHFLVVEPSLLMAYRIKEKTQLEWGIGYRPLLGKENMAYRYDGGEGEITVHKDLPNGLIMHVNLVGFF